jgi:uncharacterized protein (TIGR02246 family)
MSFYARCRAACGILLAAWGLAGCHTPPQPSGPVISIPLIQTEVRQELQNSVAAWNAGDLNGFLQVYADNATVATSDGFLSGKLAVRDFYAHNFQRGATRGQLSMDQIDVELLSADSVLVRGIYRNSVGGQTIRSGPTTLVMRRIFGRFQIIHDHSC